MCAEDVCVAEKTVERATVVWRMGESRDNVVAVFHSRREERPGVTGACNTKGVLPTCVVDEATHT